MIILVVEASKAVTFLSKNPQIGTSSIHDHSKGLRRTPNINLSKVLRIGVIPQWHFIGTSLVERFGEYCGRWEANWDL